MTTSDHLKFYKQELGYYGMVYKHCKLSYYLFLLSPIACIFLVQVISKHLPSYFYLLLPVTVGLLFCNLNEAAKKIMVRLYDTKISTPMWNSDETLVKLRALEKNKVMKNFIEKGPVFDEEEAREYAKEIMFQAEKRKVKFPFFLTVMVILCLPAWEEVISWYFNSGNINRIEDAFMGMFAVAMLSLIPALIIMMIRMFTTDVVLLFYNMDYIRLHTLSELLKEIEKDFRIARKTINNFDIMGGTPHNTGSAARVSGIFE